MDTNRMDQRPRYDRVMAILAKRSAWLLSFLMALASLAALSGCVSEIDPNLPVDELAKITTGRTFEMIASASDPTSVLPVVELPQGSSVDLLGVDTTGAWMLVFDGYYVGWIPTFASSTPSARLEPPLVIEPLDGACTRYMGATFEPDEPWVSSSEERVIVEGSIYRPDAFPDFVDATLDLSIAGDGNVTAAEYVHVPLTDYSSIVLFAYALDGLDQGSRITFELDDPSDEYTLFQASFYLDKCGTDWSDADARYRSQIPVGEVSLDLPEFKPTPTPRPRGSPASGPTPTPRTRNVTVTSEGRLIAPTRAEIQSLVDEWDRIHHAADYDLDAADLPLVLTGGALRQQQETLEKLRKSDCYWEFTDLSPSRITDWDQISVNEVIVTMRKHWDGDLYCKGRYDSRGSFDDPFDVRYQIVRTSDGWRIAEKVPLD